MPLSLQAGPLRLLYEQGMLRSVYCGDREIIRRIYFALRDRHWNTIPFTITEEHVTSDRTSFVISITAVHKERDIDFRWTGTFTGSTDGTVTASFKGMPGKSFLRKRIGWCVLHPLALCKDSACALTLEDGSIREMVFPGDEIAPHEPFPPFTTLRYAVTDTTSCICSFEGDLFETEDQRNWTDASFKTYSTPQSLPTPVEVTPDDTILQTVTLSIAGNVQEIPPSPSAEVLHTLDLPTLTSVQKPRPRIGIGISMQELLHIDVSQLPERLPVDHFRLDIDATAPLSPELASRISAWCSRYLTEMEVALFLTDTFEEECRTIAAALKPCAPFIGRVLLLHHDSSLTRSGVLSAAGEAFSYLYNQSCLFTGTDRYFVELNRAHPEPSPAGICFSANPQVHTFDDAVIMENLAGLTEVLRNAGRIAKRRQVILSPLTLRPRKNPLRPEKDGGTDARQSTSFGAAWCAGALAAVVQSSLTSCTLFSSLYGEGGLFSRPNAEAFPLFHVLASGIPDADMSGAVLAGKPGSQVAAVLSRTGDAQSLLLANLTPEPIRVSVPVLPDAADVEMLRNTNDATWGFKKSDSLRSEDVLKIEGFAVMRVRFGQQVRYETTLKP